MLTLQAGKIGMNKATNWAAWLPVCTGAGALQQCQPSGLPPMPRAPQVGAGALGCEFLKNFALMGTSCGERVSLSRCSFALSRLTDTYAAAGGVPVSGTPSGPAVRFALLHCCTSQSD